MAAKTSLHLDFSPCQDATMLSDAYTENRRKWCGCVPYSEWSVRPTQHACSIAGWFCSVVTIVFGASLHFCAEHDVVRCAQHCTLVSHQVPAGLRQTFVFVSCCKCLPPLTGTL